MTPRTWYVPFSAAMALATLEGRKRQTRRLSDRWATLRAGDRIVGREAAWMWCRDVVDGVTKTGRPKRRYVPVRSVPPVYCAGGTKPTTRPTDDEGAVWRYKTARFLPAWASRLILTATADARGERLQEITEEDARAEGIIDGGCLTCGESEPCGCANLQPSARDSFVWLWDHINGATAPWGSNPRVFVVSFKREVGRG